MGRIHQLNEAVAASRVGKYFELKARNTTFTTELRAGCVTFLTMAYILAVNALIIGDTGGTCTSDDCDGPDKSFACRFTDRGYARCVAGIRRDIITATAASSLIGCVLMGVGANLPIATAPGLGLNAYFTYNVVGYYGTGNVPYRSALAAVFVEGWIFVALAVLGVRQKLIQWVPRSIMLATSAGIGLFLAFIGLQSSEGLGVVAYEGATLVTLGGCPAKYQAKMYTIQDPLGVCSVNGTGFPVTNLPPASANHACVKGRMESAATWLGISGFAMIAILMSRSVKGAIMVGIAFVTIISWIPHHGASYLGSDAALPGGQMRMDYFKKVVQAPNLGETGLALRFTDFHSGELWVALITFLYVDFLDTTGTLFSMANFINNYVPNFVDEDTKRFPNQLFAFCVDGLATVCGALMGTSPVTAYIESASGIREGGRTGLTALVVAFFFAISLFFSPIFSSIPPYAVGPALITVGSLMIINVTKIRWDQPSQGIPAFLTIILMPLTYSISYGVIAGIVCYILINGTNFALDWLAEKYHLHLMGHERQQIVNVPEPSHRGKPTLHPSQTFNLRPTQSGRLAPAGGAAAPAAPGTPTAAAVAMAAGTTAGVNKEDFLAASKDDEAGVASNGDSARELASQHAGKPPAKCDDMA